MTARILQQEIRKNFKFRHKISGAEVSIPAINLDAAKYYLFVGLHRNWMPNDVEVVNSKAISAARHASLVE